MDIRRVGLMGLSGIQSLGFFVRKVLSTAYLQSCLGASNGARGETI